MCSWRRQLNEIPSEHVTEGVIPLSETTAHLELHHAAPGTPVFLVGKHRHESSFDNIMSVHESSTCAVGDVSLTRFHLNASQRESFPLSETTAHLEFHPAAPGNPLFLVGKHWHELSVDNIMPFEQSKAQHMF